MAIDYIKQGSDPNANMDGGDQYTGLDRFGRVIDQNWYSPSTGTSTDRFQYGYDRDGNALWRNNLVNSAFGESYTYDSLNQLTSFQRGTLNGTHTGLVGSASRSQSWSPDALGNFTSVTTNGSAQTRVHNQQNEITSISGAGAVTYDANGNTTADGSGNTYVYDAWNRLVQVKSGSTVLAAYGYNGLGERVSETHGSTTTDLYYSSGWQVLEERQGVQVQARNVWSPAGVDALVLRDQSSQHNGTLDQRLYVQQDANGDVTALVATTGGVLERYGYDPYGAVTIMSPGWAALGASAYGAIYLYQGKRLDGSAGLYDSRGRVISPTLMRPMQADPTGLGPDVNDYRWEGDGPVIGTDPDGLQRVGSVGLEAEKAYEERLRMWEQMEGKWNALTYYKQIIGYGGQIYQPADSLDGRLAQFFLGGGRLTEEASLYSRGCFGLVLLRIGKNPYDDSNFFFTGVNDAIKKANSIGDDAVIFAIQFNGDMFWKKAGDPLYPTRVLKGPIGDRKDTTDGNHATWHQLLGKWGYWEWLGPTGWAAKNDSSDQGSWEKEALGRWVTHSRKLPAYQHTIYGVATYKRAANTRHNLQPKGYYKPCTPTPAP